MLFRGRLDLDSIVLKYQISIYTSNEIYDFGSMEFVRETLQIDVES